VTSVLLLEADGPESRALAETAVGSGYQVHAATTPDQHANYSPDLLSVLSGCLLTDFSRPEHAVDKVVDYARRIGAGAVLSTNEYLTPLLARVCAALGLPGNDPALAVAARNKSDMARQFARHGVTAPPTLVVEHEDDLLGLCADGRLGFPCVIKPAEGAGSSGVTVVNSADEALDAFRAAQERRGMYEMPLDPRVLVQDYVEGTEYSVESITQHEVSTHLCLTRKTVTGGAHRVELGHGLPAVLSPDTEAVVYREAERAIAAVGIRDSASHTEVMLTPDGRCTVIEIGARLGAGQIGFLIHHALGIDPWAACLDVALGRPARLTPTRRDFAAVRFLTGPRPGRLASVTGLPATSHRVPTVHTRRTVGDHVDAAAGNGSRLGYFVVTGPNPATVERHTEYLFGRIRIEVGPHPAGA
jgi:biotin carboxylase